MTIPATAPLPDRVESTGAIGQYWRRRPEGASPPASGEFNAQLKQEFTSKIEQLLVEKPE